MDTDQDRRMTRRRKSGPHHLPRVVWRPPRPLREGLDAWAKERGMARATAATELVTRALEAGADGLSAGAADGILDAVWELRTDVKELEGELTDLRARLDTLGPGVVAVEHIVAYWMSRHPAARELGETPEMVEERLIYEMNRRGADNWGVLHEGRAKAGSSREDPPVRHLRGAIEHLLLYWETRSRSPDEVRVSPNKERRIRSFAILNRCKPGVALNALLDFALSAAGEPGVPESQTGEIKSAISEILAALGDLRTQVEALAGDLEFVGELMAGLAPLISLLCAQDPGIRHSSLQGERLGSESEELYARLSAHVLSHAVARWDGRVLSFRDASLGEEPVVLERIPRLTGRTDGSDGAS